MSLVQAKQGAMPTRTLENIVNSITTCEFLTTALSLGPVEPPMKEGAEMNRGSWWTWWTLPVSQGKTCES